MLFDYLKVEKDLHILAIGIAEPIGSYLSAFISLQQIMLISFIGPFLAFIVAATLKEPPMKKVRENYFALIKKGDADRVARRNAHRYHRDERPYRRAL